MRFPRIAITVDEEGSIVFDGEKYIVNNPSKVPDDFNWGGKPVVGLPKSHPSHPDNRKKRPNPGPAITTGLGFGPNYVAPWVAPPKTNEKGGAQGKNPLAAGSGGQAIMGFSETEGTADISALGLVNFESLPGTQESPVEEVWYGSTPLTQGQEIHVDHLLSVETDSLAREVLIGLKREGMPSDAYIADFMSQFAEWGWDDLSSALALQVLANVRDSDWDETFAYADADYVETVTQDLGNNTREGLVIIDAGSGNVVLNKTGVQGLGGQQYVGLQDYEVEALKGLDLIFVHNHTEEIGASVDDLNSAFDAGAKLLIVITPSGREQVYVRGRDRMVKVRDEKASYEVGSPTLDEALWLHAESQAQARKYEADSPELIFRQSDPEVIANMDVNPGEIARYEELKDFVTEGLYELQETGEKELLTKIGESIELLQDIFGYTVKFHKDYDVEANVRLAMEQVHNLGTILFHFLNDLGFEIMQSTPEETIFVLGADERIPKHQGLVVLPESTAKGDPELKIVYLGSEIEAGTIGHEVAHEIDRWMGDYGTAKVEYEDGSEQPISKLGPVGSFLWFLKNEVVNQRQPNLPKGALNQGYRFLEAVTNLDEYSRANFSKKEREVFADLLAAKVLGPLDEDFFATAFPYAKPIRFRNTKGSADIAIAMEQYFDDYAEYIGGDDSQKPEAFEYTKYHDQQTYDELEWPVMPVKGDEE